MLKTTWNAIPPAWAHSHLRGIWTYNEGIRSPLKKIRSPAAGTTSSVARWWPISSQQLECDWLAPYRWVRFTQTRLYLCMNVCMYVLQSWAVHSWRGDYCPAAGSGTINMREWVAHISQRTHIIQKSHTYIQQTHSTSPIAYELSRFYIAQQGSLGCPGERFYTYTFILHVILRNPWPSLGNNQCFWKEN